MNHIFFIHRVVLLAPLAALHAVDAPAVMPHGEHYALEFSTYLGGASSWDQARDVCVDRDGNVIVVGGTASTNFSVTPGAYDTTFNDGGMQVGSAGPCDVFVAKFGPAGHLQWATYLGGPNYDRAYAVETDTQGQIIVAGRAGPGFPVTAGAAQTDFQGVRAGPYGQQNAFVAKLSADGTRLLWSTYLGVGAMVRDFQLDSAGNVVAAFGSDPDSGDPPPAWFSRGYQPARRGGIESGVAKLEADGSQVVWATWFGGSGDDSSEVGVRVDAQDRVYITGNTKSTDLPIVGAESDRAHHGGWDGYLAVFSPDGSRLLCSTYLGGSADDFVLNTHALAVDGRGHAYVHCATHSTDWPTTPGVWSRTARGGVDGALVKIDPANGRLMLGTYLGGSGFDNFDGLYVDAAGNVFMSGETDSVDFPVTANPFQRIKGGGVDAVMLRLKADFSGLLYSTFVGGPADDRFRSGCLGDDGSLFGIGTSSGAGFPVRNASQPAFAGGGGIGDAMVVKFSAPDPGLKPQSGKTPAAGSATILRDRYGVPHIHAATPQAAAYALGRAQCEDRHPLVMQNLYAGAGRLAELLGESSLEADRTQRMLRHMEAAERDWTALSPALRSYLEAFTAGINDWLKEHPQPVPPMTFAPLHVLAAQRQILMGAGLAMARAEGDAEASEAAPGVPPGKSNSWAVSGRKSATGKPVLLIDPHWPIEGPLQLYEARLKAGPLDVWGFMTVGTPVVGLGTTPGVAWTFTAGGADSSDAFALRLKPGDATQYEWDGKWVPMEIRRETFRVRDGKTFREVTAEFRYTRHGPVLTNRHGEPFAARLPGWDECRSMEQFWRMNHARTGRELKAALALDQLSYFNLVWSTRDGDIGYVQLGQVPQRPPGYDWTHRIPGWTSVTWSRERVPVSALPTVENPSAEFLQNCNVAANAVTPGLTMKREDFGPGVLFGHYGAYRARGQRATALLSQASLLDFETARAIVFDTRCLPADLWVPVIVEAYREAGKPAELAQAVELLARWNRRADRDSTSATLFRFWRFACDASPGSQAGRDDFTVPNTAAVRTDSLNALRTAVAELKRRYGRLAVPWGDIKRLRRGAQEWPLSGDGLEFLGLDTLRATAAAQLDRDGKLITIGGQTATALVTWNDDHPLIQAVAGYGQSAQPGSHHYADQAPLYAREELRRVPWTEAEAHASVDIPYPELKPQAHHTNPGE